MPCKAEIFVCGATLPINIVLKGENNYKMFIGGCHKYDYLHLSADTKMDGRLIILMLGKLILLH